MTAPRFLTVPDSRWAQRQIIRFGGLPRPDNGITQPFIDLNDGDSWWASDIQIDHSNHISNKNSQLNWRGKGVWTAQDFLGRKITIPANYDEGNSGGVSYPDAKGVMTMAGEQYLTFDNVTGIRVRLNSFSVAKMLTPHPPYLWDAPLEFLSRNPFAEDLGGPISHTITLAAGSPTFGTGASGYFHLDDVTFPSYKGHAYGEPVVGITFGSGSDTVTAFRVQNLDQAIYAPVSIVGHTGFAVYVDSELFSIYQIGGAIYPPSGTFPFLWPGTNIVLVEVGDSSNLSDVTATLTYANKWEL